MNELKHVAIITDGNGRWATSRGLPRQEGHTEGRKKLDEIWDWCIEKGISYLSCYVLSLDNLGREQAEVDHIHALARELCNADGIKKAVDKGIRLLFCGRRENCKFEDREAFEKAERETAGCDKLTVMLQSYYGGRDEIVRAARACVEEGVEISEDNISARLYSAGHHTDPDLIIRTGGYQRLSGYLPWESVYSELYFTPTLFPDLSREEFLWACKWFEGIHRTHGGDREPTVAKNATVQKGAPFARKGAANG